MKILGVRVDNLTMTEAVSRVGEMIAGGGKHYVATPNPEFLVDAQRDSEFRKILNGADLSLPDGIGLVFVSRVLGKALLGRVSGTDFMERLCEEAAKRGWGVFLLGAREGVADKASKVLAERYPGLKVLGSSAGSERNPFDTEMRDEITRKVGDEQIDLLFVAFGHGKQEKWIVSNLPYLNVAVAVGVGGAFDFISGRVKRAPRWAREIGLEWLWRLFREPWRVRRIFKAVVVFPWLVLKERITYALFRSSDL